MADSLLFLTELMGMRVYDLKGRRIGRVRDAGVVPRTHPSRVDRFLVGGEWNWWTIRHDQVATISIDGIYLRDEQVTPYHDDEYMLRIVRDLLDQQIIDVHGRKVVRVTDITFALNRVNDHDALFVSEVDVGLRSMFRRLTQGLLPPRLIRRLMMRITPRSIRWEFANIIESDPQRRLRLNISHRGLEEMHPADLADIVEELSHEDREAIFEAIDSEVAAETLSEVEDPKMQAAILESLDADRAAEIVEEMEADEAADVLGEMEEASSEAILEEMDSEDKEEVEELLEFDENSAGGLMNTHFFSMSETATVADAVKMVRENAEYVDSLTTVFLTGEAGRLAGALPVGRLLLVEPTAVLKALVWDEEVISVPVTEHGDKVTELVHKYNLMALPVVDEAGRLVGAVTADDVIAVLRED